MAETDEPTKFSEELDILGFIASGSTPKEAAWLARAVRKQREAEIVYKKPTREDYLREYYYQQPLGRR